MITLLKGLLIVGYGLNAGFFFSFSNTVLPALNNIDAEGARKAMRSINVAVMNSQFKFLFGSSVVVSLASLVWAAGVYNYVLIISSLLFLMGTVGVTLIYNVPLNDQLERDAIAWMNFERQWLFGNHIRTMAAFLAMVILLLNLLISKA